MPLAQYDIAFRPEAPLNTEFLRAERHYWDYMLKDLTDTTYYNISKQFLINSLIHNYRKQPISNTNTFFNLHFHAFKRIDTPDIVAHYIKTSPRNNQIYFISKTSVSGRQIATIANDINATEDLTFTEDLTTSLYLQTSASHPVRVFKLIDTCNSEAAAYFVIGSNKMLQNVFYTCLALVPKWFPEILGGLDDARKNALIKVFTAIGRMNNSDYYEALVNCFDLLYEPEKQPIDFSSIANFLQIDITAQINNLKSSIENHQRDIDNYLRHYQDSLTHLRQQQHKLTALLTEQKKDNINVIADAQNCKSIIDYYTSSTNHVLTIKSKMILDSKAIVTKILEPSNTVAQQHYHILREPIRRLFEDLWIKETLQLYFCTTFYKTTNATIPTSIKVPKRTKETKNTMPNPHLVHYSCFGSNKKVLIDAATNNNLQYYLGALTACNSNLNTGDATVLKRFCYELLTTFVNDPILYDVETKTYVTPSERIRNYETV